MRTVLKLSCALVLLWISDSQGVPFLPTSPDTVLERLPIAANQTDQELRQLQQQLNTQPDNLDLAIRVASRLIETARNQAEPRYYGYAEAALNPWWRLPDPPAEVLLLRATINQHRHDFTGALADLQTILADRPAHFQARLTEAVILGVQGDYPAALRSCLLLTRLGNRLVAATCIANIQSLSGQARQAYRYLGDIISNSPETASEQQLWSLTVLAEIAVRLGESQAAEAHFLKALALPQRDVYLLGAYADFLLDQQRPAEVITLLKDNYRPDGLLLRLALAEQATNALPLADHIAELDARIFAYRQRGDAIHQREEARYSLHLLKQPEQALQLALANWQIQREPADARLVLEAALAGGYAVRTSPVINGTHSEPCLDKIKPVLDWLKANKLEDTQLQALTQQLESS